MDNNIPEAGSKPLAHLFRSEYTRMTAILFHHFGLRHIEIAEDIASETFLKASENWKVNGIPENPTAWLYTVAKNKTKDYMKHIAVVEAQVKITGDSDRIEIIDDFELTTQNVSDSQLAMIFAVCNPSNSSKSQICLALQILCGFSIEEIANAFLSKNETIKKRLQRAKINLRDDDFQIGLLKDKEVKSRLDTVLKTLYLLFNEGYFSATNNQLIRKDLCAEAIRLILMLIENPLTSTPKANALLALMCFQSSRFDARINHQGEAIVYEHQDKTLWDKLLIEKGNYYLVSAFNGHEISRYHLEASIAYWHTTPTDERKWQHILKLYNQLILMEYSPITALNRLFAFAKVYGNEKAIAEGEKLNLGESNYYHELLGYLYMDINIKEAINHYEKAISLTKSKTVKRALAKEIERMKKK